MSGIVCYVLVSFVGVLIRYVPINLIVFFVSYTLSKCKLSVIILKLCDLQFYKKVECC